MKQKRLRELTQNMSFIDFHLRSFVETSWDLDCHKFKKLRFKTTCHKLHANGIKEMTTIKDQIRESDV